MKWITIALILLSPMMANAMLIDSTSAPIGFSGTGITVDVLDGADIAANTYGDSIGFSGLNHVINISGGVLQGGIGFSGFDHVFNITGGLLGGDIHGSGYNHIFNFTGYDLVLNANNISGFLLDGSAIDLNISGAFINPQFYLSNVAVPEPSTLVLSVFALAGLGLSRRRKSL